MPVMLGGFSIPHSLSFLEGSSYTKNNGYLGVIMQLSGIFSPKTQLIDALIESYGLLKENGGPMWTAASQTS
ncbi:MAG: hypothetical protein O6918_10115 [Deltaproteobacteria bacterium]|nr:hypothetical protein [Deltaproteobacteria bacterium]